MKRIENILAEVHQHKICTKRQLYRYLKQFNITPVGVRQRPQLYPDDAAQRVLLQLGLIEGPHGILQNPEHQCGSSWPDQPAARKATPIVSMRQLRHERTKSARRAA